MFKMEDVSSIDFWEKEAREMGSEKDYLIFLFLLIFPETFSWRKSLNEKAISADRLSPSGEFSPNL